MRNKPITVINFTAPELNHLAAALDRAGLLSAYVRPYSNQDRAWERALAKIPVTSAVYRRTFGRRRLPDGLGPERVHQTAVAADLLSAAMRQLPGYPARAVAVRLRRRMQQHIANVGARHSRDAKLTVASYLLAEPAFRRTEGVRVLNYPIAHHRYIQDFVTEEAEREPGFAQTLPNWNLQPSWVEPRLDAECALADRILVGSTFARDSFVSEGIPAEKLLVVPYGAAIDRFKPARDFADKADEFRLLFVGQISQRKGISYLLRAYETFHGLGTRLTLIGGFYGDDSALAPYRNLFEHIPHLPQMDLINHYQRADVFVFPSLIEGLGLVVLEAMACGLPVITTPNGPGDIVRDGVDGFVVPIRNPDAIVEKLEYLRANPEHRREMGINARQRALEFSWAAYQHRGVEALTALIGGMSSTNRFQPVVNSMP